MDDKFFIKAPDTYDNLLKQFKNKENDRYM